MAYAFEPVGVFSTVEGLFLQLPRIEGSEPSLLNRDAALARLRLRLLRRAGCRLAGADSDVEIGRMAERPGVPVESVMRRWSRLTDYVNGRPDYRQLVARKNGIVNACKRDIAGRNEFADALLDERALVWQLAAKHSWKPAELAAYRAEIAHLRGRIPPLLTVDGIGSDAEWASMSEDLLRPTMGMPGWTLVNVIFYCLHVAQTSGDTVSYALIYRLVLDAARRMKFVVSEEARTTALVGTADARKNARRPAVDVAVIDRLLFMDFWQEFGEFLQDWYSRIRTFALHPVADLPLHRELRMLEAAGVDARWQVVEPEDPARQVTDLWFQPEDLSEWVIRPFVKYPKVPDNLVASSFQVAQDKEMFCSTWVRLPECLPTGSR